MPRLLLPLVLAAILVPAASARAGVLPVAVTISGEQQTSWTQPKSYGYEDCYHKHWAEADGGRKLEFSVSGRGELRTGAVAPFITWRSERPGAVSFGGLVDPTATVTRRYYGLSGADPGTCGGGSPAVPADASACGSRRIPHSIMAVFHRGKVRVDANPVDVQFGPDCGPTVGSCMQDPDGFSVLAKPYSLKRLRRGKSLELNASARCSKTLTVRGAPTTWGGSISWQLEIRPVGRWRRR
jgi:hypothetical protein